MLPTRTGSSCFCGLGGGRLRRRTGASDPAQRLSMRTRLDETTPCHMVATNFATRNIQPMLLLTLALARRLVCETQLETRLVVVGANCPLLV